MRFHKLNSRTHQRTCPTLYRIFTGSKSCISTQQILGLRGSSSPFYSEAPLAAFFTRFPVRSLPPCCELRDGGREGGRVDRDYGSSGILIPTTTVSSSSGAFWQNSWILFSQRVQSLKQVGGMVAYSTNGSTVIGNLQRSINLHHVFCLVHWVSLPLILVAKLRTYHERAFRE